MFHYYDRSGAPITLERWAQHHHDIDYKRVAATDLVTSDNHVVWVSTVWVGFDLAPWIDTKRPYIFETAVFEHGMADTYMERHATETDALDAHDRIVRTLTAQGLDALTDEPVADRAEE
ncbi:hypothetical protein [Gryllotalpicola protaetiae]|uniref:Uncharacterized protein n=1 Tax=Gryllotalpicola protaetiae TaxID=2419771 RepID=A0A387BMX5_9MICO|nr:hypothetical protein [Gryllotalpicola protaetiae]AYG02380.1 hypothetical protein D7I44_01745 [Gryllotalpicola protaetiae]